MMNKITLATITLLAVSVTCLMPVTPTLAVSAEASGCSHGTSDGNIANRGSSNMYILQPGKGFAFHTKAFNEAYVRCFCAVSHSGSDADQATFNCPASTNNNHARLSYVNNQPSDGVVDASSQAAANNQQPTQSQSAGVNIKGNDNVVNINQDQANADTNNNTQDQAAASSVPVGVPELPYTGHSGVLTPDSPLASNHNSLCLYGCITNTAR